MRINFILPTVGMSGGIKVISIYARALHAAGHEVVLVSPPPRKLSWRKKMKSMIRDKKWGATSRQPPSPLDGLALDHRILDQWRPPTDADVPDGDVVVATWWETAEWVNSLGMSKGAKVYFVQGHETFPNQPGERVAATYRLPMRKIVVSKWLQEVMHESYDDPNTDLVLNAVDHRQFNAPPRVRQRTPTMGFLYSDSSVKAIDVVLEVVTAVRASIPNLRVICFGAYRPENDSILGSHIEFYYSPAQDQIRNIYSQCDVWLSASRSEGFNLTVAEAMACRTPVVATKTGWPKEALSNGQSGFLKDIDDVPGLIASVRTILTMPDDAWQTMSNNACSTANSLSWDASAANFESALLDTHARTG